MCSRSPCGCAYIDNLRMGSADQTGGDDDRYRGDLLEHVNRKGCSDKERAMDSRKGILMGLWASPPTGLKRAILLTLLVGLVLALTPATESEGTTRAPSGRYIEPADQGIVLPVASNPALEETTSHFGLEGRSRVVVVQEPVSGAMTGFQSSASERDSVVQPQWSVGFGWYIYIYLTRSDWIYLAGLGGAVGSAVLCGWLAGVLGVVACAVAAYIVFTWIGNYTAPPSGWCREFRFTYIGTPAGSKLVRC